MANKQEYTLILAYANTLAKSSGYKQAIRPITKWARPTDQATVGAFSLTSAGILTAAESCVISNFRLEYTLIAEGPAAKELMQEHLITFIMAMRHSPDWDYEHTNQLSKDEREGILAFVSSEEGVVPLENEDEEDFNNSTIKKP